MMTTSTAPDRGATTARATGDSMPGMGHSPAGQLFVLSCLALTTTAMTFGIRAGMITQLGESFALTGPELGLVAGTAFWGFTVSQMIGGAVVDQTGMKPLLWLAMLGHLLGVGLTIMAGGFWGLFLSTLMVGLANGAVEAVCNPLVTALYPDDKTRMLNRFHVWFPGGIVIGGLISYFFDQAGLGWKIKMGTILLPALGYGAMLFNSRFPVTERVAKQVSYGSMWQALARPLFLLMAGCMLLTAATELGTNQFIDALLRTAAVPAILLLVWISVIMAVGRYLAGPIVHRLAPAGTLFVSAVLACGGLLWLSTTEGLMAFVAAALFALGICYFWPTMLGFVNEYLPETGALGLSVMGGLGMLSVAIVLPAIGAAYDQATADALGAGLPEARARLEAGQETLRSVAILPAALAVIFGGLWWRYRNPVPQSH